MSGSKSEKDGQMEITQKNTNIILCGGSSTWFVERMAPL